MCTLQCLEAALQGPPQSTLRLPGPHATVGPRAKPHTPPGHATASGTARSWQRPKCVLAPSPGPRSDFRDHSLPASQRALRPVSARHSTNAIKQNKAANTIARSKLQSVLRMMMMIVTITVIIIMMTIMMLMHVHT